MIALLPRPTLSCQLSDLVESSRRILDMVDSGEIKLAVSDAMLEEIADVLQCEKIGWSAVEAGEFVEVLSRLADHVHPQQVVDVIKDDPDVNRILECAGVARSDYLITGDRHLLKLGQFGQTKIVKPVEFLELMQGRSR